MSDISARLISVLVFSVFALPGASAAEYTLMPSPQTVHVGYFSALQKPVLTVDSGDIVTIESVGGPDPVDIEASGVVPASAIPDYVRAFAATSPIAVPERTS
jgi:acetamidase/formamidase